MLVGSITAIVARAQEATPLPRVHVYQSPAPGPVNTYWIEGPEGVVVLDCQRSLTRAREALAEIKASGRPVVAIVVSHPHTDHFGGLGVFAEAFPQAPILASQATVDVIRADPGNFFKLTKQLLKDDFPDRATVPTRVFADGKTLRLAGVEFQTGEFGAGEAPSQTVFYLPAAKALFTGDIVIDHLVPFLLNGHSAGWLEQIARLGREFPQAQTLYPGHGAPGAPAPILARQADYLSAFRQAVAARLPAGAAALEPAARKAVVDEMASRYPDWTSAAPIPDLLGINADALARELAGGVAVGK